MKKIKEIYKIKNGIFSNNDNAGYWSNFNEKDQQLLFKELQLKSAKKVIDDNFPKYSKMIFDSSRCLGLELLDINDNQIGIDYGCMWGNLLIHCSKKAKFMVGVDQTLDSLKFVNKRLDEEKLNNTFLIQENLRNRINLNNTFDFSIINGVLEWIPTRISVDLNTYFNNKDKKDQDKYSDPRSDQLNFLKNVNSNLKKGGKLYLAIENKFDYQHFLWKKDPHSGLMYTAFLPRFLSNLISKIRFGRSYVNYIYSKNELKNLLTDSGYKNIEFFATFPDYRFPKKIIPLNKNFNNKFDLFPYEGKRTDFIARCFKKFRKGLDWIIYKKLKLFYLSPSFIVIAEK